METIAVLVHGFNVVDPNRSICGLTESLERIGYTVHKFLYGRAGFMDIRLSNDNLAWALLSQIHTIQHYAPDKRIIPIGHSNGCALIKKAGQLQDATNPAFSRCIYISPALNTTATLGPQITRCDVMHNVGDEVVKWSSYIPMNSWGRMGNIGYNGTDSRYVNHDCSQSISGHSDWFRRGNIESYTAQALRSYLDLT